MRLYEFITFGEVIDAAIRQALGSTQSLLSEFQPVPLLDEVQRIESDFLKAAHTMGPNGGWSFEESFYEYITFSGTTLNGAISAGDASLILTDASSFPSAGRIVIETDRGALDFVDYTAKATNTLTVGTEPIGIAHSSGEDVEPLYALPSNFSKMIDMRIDGDAVEESNTSLFPTWGYRYVGRYLLLPKDLGTRHVSLRYTRGATYLTNTLANITTNRATETGIPKDFARYPIERLKAHIYRTRERYDKASQCEGIASAALRDALAYDVQGGGLSAG